MYSVPCARFALAEHQRADADGVAEAEDAVADDHGNDGISRRGSVVHAG